jgi:hypothetical protein
MSPRRSSAELRRLLLDAGLTVLYRRGLRATASHVPMTEAIETLERSHGITVGMGSIFGKGRLWADVKEFQLDLFEAAVLDESAGGPNDRSLTLIEQLPDQRNEPYEARLATLVDLCRIAGLMNGYVARDTKRRGWRLWVGIWATAMTDDDAERRLSPSLRRQEERINRSFVAVYRVMLDRLGLRVREPYTIEQLATLAAAATDGLAFRSAIIPDVAGEIASPRARGDDEPWNLLGVALTAIATELIEDDAPAESH